MTKDIVVIRGNSKTYKVVKKHKGDLFDIQSEIGYTFIEKIRGDLLKRVAAGLERRRLKQEIESYIGLKTIKI